MVSFASFQAVGWFIKINYKNSKLRRKSVSKSQLEYLLATRLAGDPV